MDSSAMKKTLFYGSTGAFAIVFVLTIASVFWGFGKPTETERSQLFYSFIIEIGVAVAALFYVTFDLRKNQDIVKNCDECLVKFGNKVDVLVHDIEFACKVLNVQGYGGLKFHAGDFHRLWKRFAYEPEIEFFVVSYIPAHEWTDDYAQRILVPTKSRIETDKIRALRIFVIDNDSELATLSKIIQLHKQYGIPVAYVSIDKLVEKGICKRPLDHSFILIDNNTLVLFHLEDRKISYFEVITDTQEIRAHKQKFQAIESLSTSA